MLRQVILSASVLLLATGAAFAQVHSGAGSQSCGQWVEARRDKSGGDGLRTAMMASWVQGYLAGNAQGISTERVAQEAADRVEKGLMNPNVTDEQMAALARSMFKTESGMIFDPPDADAIKVWIDKYCTANPLAFIELAAGELASELVNAAESDDRAKPKPKPR